MSKKSQREAREQKEAQLLERQQRFVKTLNEYLNRFASYYRQTPPDDQAIAIYELGLRHLTPKQLEVAYEESIKKCKFFPSVAEMLEYLKDWEDRQPETPSTTPHYEIPKDSPTDRAMWNELFADKWAQLTARKPWHDGLRWNFDDDVEDEAKYGKGRRENGWRPREESLQREIEREALKGKQPRFNIVDKRIAPVAVREPGEEG